MSASATNYELTRRGHSAAGLGVGLVIGALALSILVWDSYQTSNQALQRINDELVQAQKANETMKQELVRVKTDLLQAKLSLSNEPDTVAIKREELAQAKDATMAAIEASKVVPPFKSKEYREPFESLLQKLQAAQLAIEQLNAKTL